MGDGKLHLGVGRGRDKNASRATTKDEDEKIFRNSSIYQGSSREITERVSEDRLQNLCELCVLGGHSLFSSGSHAELSGEVCSVVNFAFSVHSHLLHQPMHLQSGPVVPLRFAAPMC